MRHLRIGIDIDGVIVDLVSSMLPLLSKACGRPVSQQDIYCFDIGKALNIEEKMPDIWAQVYHSNMLRFASPIKGAIASLSALSEHEIWLVTRRPISTQRHTISWLREKKVKYDHLIFDSSPYKHSVVRNLDLFVEDNLEQACVIAEAGIFSLLLDQPWNQTPILPKHCKRVQDWDAIALYIKKLEEA